MTRTLAVLALALSTALAPSALMAQATSKAPAQKAAAQKLKVGKDEKVCSYRFSSGELRKWVCKKELPCCAWDAISYVKCGSTFTGCL